MLGQKKLLIVKVNRAELTIFDGQVERKMSLPVEVVMDMEVKDKDALYNLVKDFVKEIDHELEIVWIFEEEVCFEKMITPTEGVDSESEVLKFLELLPFAETYNRVYESKEGNKKVVAINKSFYDALRKAFAVQGFETRIEIPVTMMPGEWSKEKSIKSIFIALVRHLAEAGKLRLAELTAESIHEEKELPRDKEGSKSQLKLLLTVFVILLGLLGVVIYLTYYK